MAGARKPRVRSEDAKARLIEATIDLLRESSVFEISTRAIGERADLDRRAITRQFGGETELFLATLEELYLRSVRAAQDETWSTESASIDEWSIRTNLLAYLILSGVDPERLRALQLPLEGQELALGVIGLSPDAPPAIGEAFLALLQGLALSVTFFGPASPRSTPENRLHIMLMLRYLASLGPELPGLIGLPDHPADSGS
jgi:AcrR family transcriptional regulator